MDEEIDPATILTFDNYVQTYGAIDATTDPHVVAVRIVDEDMKKQSPEQKMNETQREATIAEYERLVPLYIKFSAKNQQAQPQPQPQPQAVRELFHDSGPEWFGSSLKLAFPKSVDGAGAALASHPGFLDTGAALASHPGFLDTGAALASDFDHDDFLDTGFGAALTSGLNPREATEQFTQILESCELNVRDKAYEEFMKLLKLKLIDRQHPLDQKMMNVFKQFMTVWTIELKQLLYTKKKGKFTPTPDETENYKNALLCTAQSFFSKRASATAIYHRRMTTRVGIFNHDTFQSLLSRTKARQMFQVVTKSDTASLLPLGSSSEKFVELETASIRSATGRRIDYFQAEIFKKLSNVKIVVPSDQSRMSIVVSDLFTSKPKKMPDVIKIPKELTEDPMCVQLIGNKVFNLKNLDEILEQTEHFEHMLQVEEFSSGSNKRERIKCIVMALELLDESKNKMLDNIENAKYQQLLKEDPSKMLYDREKLTEELERKTERARAVIANITREYDAVFECHSKVKSYLTKPEPELDQAKESLECTQRAALALKNKIKSNTAVIDDNQKTASRLLVIHEKISGNDDKVLKSKPVSDLLGVKCTLYTIDHERIVRQNTVGSCEFFKSVSRECAFFTASALKLVDDAQEQIKKFEEVVAAAKRKALADGKKALAASNAPVKAVQVANPPIPPVQVANPPIPPVQAASNAPVQTASNAPIQAASNALPPVKKTVKKAAVIVKEEAPVKPAVQVLIDEMHALKKDIKADLKKCQKSSTYATQAVIGNLDEAKQASFEARQACDSVVTQTSQYITKARSRFSLDETFVDAATAIASAEKDAEAAQAAAQAAETAAQALQTLADRNAKRRSDSEAFAAAIERKRMEDEANAAAAIERKRMEDEANAAAVAVEFKNLFTCDFETMLEVAQRIKHLPDHEILRFFQSKPHLTKYMLFNDTFTRTFFVVGILQKYLKESHSILVTGKTALQLTAVVNDVTIVRSPQVVSDQLTAPGVCIFKPCSDFDISLVSTVTATRPLKQAFLDTFLSFFDTAAGSLQNLDSDHHKDYEKVFLRTPNTFLTVRTVNAANTMTVKKSLGHGKKLDVLDVKFLTVGENMSVFPGLNPNTIQLDATGLLRTDVLLQSPQNVHDIQQEQKVLDLINQYRKFIQEPGVIDGNAEDIAEKLELFLYNREEDKPGHEARERVREHIARDVESFYIPIRQGIVLSNQPGPQQPPGVIFTMGFDELAVQQALADTNDEQAAINFLLEQQQEEQTAAQRPDGAAAPHVLNFSFPDLPSFLHECVQITIRELSKLLGNKDLLQIENYFFTISTLLKFFSRAVQLSYIISGKESGGGSSTRVVFDRAVALFTPNQELNNIIIAILHLFLIDDNTLKPETFREFADYKETGKRDSDSRKVMSFHDKIIEILTAFKFNLPPPNRMGGKKNKLKTKRKAMKERKTRKARKTRKSNQNNKKKRFTRNISPYKLANKSRGRRTRKY